MRSPNHLAIATMLLTTCCSVSTANAAAYRCVKDDGHVSYQQIRCDQNSKPLAINRSRTGWTGLRSGERTLLGDYQKRDARKKPTPQKENPKTDNEAKVCRSRKTRLDAVKEKLRRGYNIKESDRLHQQRNDHEDYLRQFCSR